MIPFANKDIEKYLKSLSEAQQDIVLKIRDIVLSADNKMKEGMKWGSIAFFNKKNICGFRIAKGHVTLLFMEGAKLNDKLNILDGNGAKARTYKVSFGDKINTDALTDLVRQSLESGM